MFVRKINTYKNLTKKRAQSNQHVSSITVAVSSAFVSSPSENLHSGRMQKRDIATVKYRSTCCAEVKVRMKGGKGWTFDTSCVME